MNSHFETVYLILKKLPSAWDDGIPTYNMCNLIDSVVAEDPEEYESFNWHITGHDLAPLEIFAYMPIEVGDCYLIEVDEDDKQMRFKNWIGRYYTDAVYQENMATTSEATQLVDHSDCEPAGVDSFDVKDDCKGITKIKITGVDSFLKSDSSVGTISHDSVDQSEEDQPRSTVYLVCHKGVGMVRQYTLMRQLPLSWSAIDSIYYNKSDVIEDVVPGCKYNFTQLNMSAYAYAQSWMGLGDAVSCEMCGNCLDHVIKLDKYSIQDEAYMKRFRKNAKRIKTTPICIKDNDAQYYTYRHEVVDSKAIISECKLVCWEDAYSKNYSLLKRLPESWDGNVPEFDSEDLIKYVNFPDKVVDGCHELIRGNLELSAGDVYCVDYDSEIDVIYLKWKYDRFVTESQFLKLKSKESVCDSDESCDSSCRSNLVDEISQELDDRIEEVNNNKDGVIRPNYYILDTPNGPIECKDIVGNMCYNCGTAITYIWRAGRKVAEGMSIGDKEINDLEKAIMHIAFEIERLGGKVDWSKFTRK